MNIVYMMNHSLYEHFQYTFEIKKMSKVCDFEGISKTECNLQHLTRNCRIKNLDDFERDEADAQSRTFKCEEQDF